LNILVVNKHRKGTRVGDFLTGKYQCSDMGEHLESVSTFRWLRDDIAIIGATGKTYKLTQADEGKALTFEVTHVVTAGDKQGLSIVSSGVISAISVNPVASNLSVDNTQRMIKSDSLLTASYAALKALVHFDSTFVVESDRL
jgi:hypothetical protein